MTKTILNLLEDKNDDNEIANEGEIKLEDIDNELDEETGKKEDESLHEAKKKNDDNIKINKSKIAIIKKLLSNIKENNDKLIDIFSGMLEPDEENKITIGQISEVQSAGLDDDSAQNQNGKIIEGVFDGENMIGPDGKQYSVPANYASKSKLVEGDIMKLIITEKGTFIYKQIGPIERSRIVGDIELDSNSNFYVKFEDKKWRVLTASVTYYKGQAGDQAVILIPKNGESKWAAVENVVKKEQL